MAKSVKNFIPISKRVMLLQLNASPVNMNILQVYAPTADKADEEVFEFYQSINEILKDLKQEDVTIVMGDLNAKLGSGRTSEVVGAWGLGERNPRGDELEIFAEMNKLVVLNTWFKLPPRKLYTWKSPMDSPNNTVRNQIDYIMVNKRFRNSCISVKTYPGADIQSDHVPLVGIFKVKMKRVNPRKHKTYDLRQLKNETVRASVRSALKDKMENKPDPGNPEVALEHLQQAVKEVKEEYLKPDKRKKKSWMTDDILALMEQRRIVKGKAKEYKEIQTVIRRKIREAKDNEKQEQCLEVEYYQSRYDDFNVHRKVKEITGRLRKKTAGKLVDDDGNLVISKEEQNGKIT
uniref:Craniofacial development protein 2 n=1 Tax=Cacopsylla melanoneura TaxID=428564 RepID=A0A8D8X189_9HEMI